MLTLVIRTIILYITVVFALRIMGKRQIGEMQPSELVITLLISDLASLPMTDLSSPILNGIISIFVLVVLEILVSTIGLKHLKFRHLLSGQPVIIINNGVIDQSKMKSLNLTIEDLMEELRLSGVFELDEVAYAIIEVNGKLSVLKQHEAQTPVKLEMKIPKPNKGIPVLIVNDGEIQAKSLDFLSITEDRVINYLNNKNLKLSQVFIMTGDKYNNFNVIERTYK